MKNNELISKAKLYKTRYKSGKAVTKDELELLQAIMDGEISPAAAGWVLNGGIVPNSYNKFVVLLRRAFEQGCFTLKK